MTEQGSLGDFQSGDDERPEEEAEYVAGADGGRGTDVVDPELESLPDATGEVELRVMQVDYTIEGYGSEETPVLHVFGRTAAGDLEHVRVREFEPYFYVPVGTVDEEALRRRDRITGVEYGFESIRGEELLKVKGQTPRDVGQIRDEFDHFEADVLFPNRLMIDAGIESGVRVPERRLGDEGDSDERNRPIEVHFEELEPVDVQAEARVHTLDIEVNDREGFPEDGEEPIICLTAHDSYRDEYVGWVFEPEDADDEWDHHESLDEYDPISEGTDPVIRAFEDEAEMLLDYLEYVDEDTDPDVLTGWNCLPAGTEVAMADGRTKEIQEVEIGDRVVGSDDQAPTEATVTNKWQSEKQIYDFQLADGTSLQASGDHEVMIGGDEVVDWKEASDIESGEFLLKPRKLTVENPVVPTLRELVPAENQRFAEKGPVSEFKENLPYGAVSELAEEFNLAKGTLYHPKTDVWTPERCREAADKFEVPLPDGGRVYRRTGVKLERELTEKELYLAGLVLTDGTMSRKDGVRFYNTREELHDQFPDDNQLEPDGKGCYKQNVLDFATMHAFNGLGIPFGDKNSSDVDLSQIYAMPEAYISRFLAGAIDGDGNVASSVSIAAENRSIGEWYVKLFKRLGIYAEQRENVVRVPDAKRDLDRLKQQILPHIEHSEKKAAIEALDGGKSGRTENIPYALFEASDCADTRRIGNDKHRRGINLKRHETDSEQWEEYVFVEVESVATSGTRETYDIETTTHNFLAEGCLVHNCDDFDIPYLLDRLEVLDERPDVDQDLSIDQLSRVDEVWRSNYGAPDVKGRVVFDLLYAYQRTQFSELDSYRLDDVAEMELGVGKERYMGDLGDLWEEDPEQLLKYNVRDVELCVELDRKQDVIAFWDEVRSFVGCKLEDATTPGDAVDMYVLHKVHNEFVLPSKGQQESEDYEGGAVFDPITGVREMVSVLDLKSLYPMCMVTTNASPETKVDPEGYDGETYRAPNGTHFRKEPDGIIREMVDELLAERDQKKALRDEHDPDSEDYDRYDRQQSSVKVIMNSLYGVLGWDRFRLYDKEMGAAVTATGREVIEFTETAANEIGHQVVYGDTDSVMLELGGEVSTEDAIEQSFDIEEHINGAYDEFAAEELNAEEHRFQIEFEKLYRRFFQAGKKKRYAGHIVWKEGKEVDDVDITGFEYQRSDIAPITKEVQKRVIDMIVHGEDTETVTDYVHEVIEDFQAGNVDPEQVGIPGGIGKRLDNYDTDTAQVRGAKFANLLLGTNFARGSKPKRLYVSNVHPEFFRRMENEEGLDPHADPLYREFKEDVRDGDGVICIEYADQLPEEFEVDWEKMLEKTLQGPIERILQALDVSWEEVESGQEQTGLESFM